MSAPDDRFYHPRITQRVDLSPTLWTIRLAVEVEFSFAAGQYATLGVEDADGKRWERPYSIASSPHEREVEFFLELVPHGDLTPLLYKLKVGDPLLMRKAAKGRFTLDTTRDRSNHLLICTVTGVAPFVSFVRALSREGQNRRFAGEHKLFLLNGASRPWEFGYKEELSQFDRELDWFKYVATVSRPWDHGDWPGEIGRADDILRKYADHWELDPTNTLAYLCGHPEMIEHSKAILKRRGFTDKNAIKEEIYWVPAK